MAQEVVVKASRNKERLFLALITIVLGLLFHRLYTIKQNNFADVDKRLQDGTMVNLNAKDPAKNISALLQKGYYFEDKRDIDLIENVIAAGITPGNQFENIGDLNKKKFNVAADEAMSNGGKSFRERVLVSRALLGYTGDDSIRFVQEQKRPPALPAVTEAGFSGSAISGEVTEQKQPVAGVLIRLQMLLPQDSTYSDEEASQVKTRTEEMPGLKKVYVTDQQKQEHLQSLTAFARTDDEGHYAFKNLPDGKAFEVLPLQPNYQFGRSSGTESLDKDVVFNFIRSPHTIKLLSTRDFNILKKEKSLIIRTQAEFNRWFWIIVICFFGCFLLMHIILSWKFATADQLILPFIMVLTGLSFLTLLSLQDPLRDRFFAKDSLVYLAMGFAAMLVMQLFNMRRFTVDSLLYRLLIFKNNRKAANGWPWIIIAITLLMLTIRFGTGPEGSGVKVNLFGVQPSEIVKYLVIIFLAGFFAVNERFISEYASWNKRFSFFAFAVIAIGAALFLFLILGDLGPAMVICFTFIILFSFSRGDFMFMALSVIFYVLVTWVFKNVWLSALLTVVMLIAATWFKRKQLSESAVMALIIIAGFLTIDKIPHLDKLIPGPVQRLVDRKAIWQDAWDNEVYGGDQVANGLWAMPAAV